MTSSPLRAAAEQNGRVVRHTQLPQQRGHVQRKALIQFGGVKFQIANDVDGFGAAADFPQTSGIGFILHADTGKRREERTEQKSPSFVTAIRTVGQPGVDQKKRDAQFFRAPDEIGPDFRLDEHDGFRVDGGQRAADGFPPVNRIVNFADVRGQMAEQFTHAGRRRGGHHNFEVWHAGFQRADELRA